MLKNIQKMSKFFILLIIFIALGYNIGLAQNASAPNSINPIVAAPQNAGQAPNSQAPLYDWDSANEVNWSNTTKNDQQLMQEFQNIVKQEILDGCGYPPLVKGRQKDRTVELVISIDAKGVIGDIDVNNSSGQKQLDAALMLSARRISKPLVPPRGMATNLLIPFKHSEIGKNLAEMAAQGDAAPGDLAPEPEKLAPKNTKDVKKTASQPAAATH